MHLGQPCSFASGSNGMASSSSSSSHRAASGAEDSRLELAKKIRSHEVAIAEMNSLAPSRAVYQKNGNIFFRKNNKTAITFEQKQLDLAKSQLQKLNAA